MSVSGSVNEPLVWTFPNSHYGYRQKAEDRAGELNSALSSTQKAYQNEINALKKKTKEQREKIDVLNNQVGLFFFDWRK